MALKIVNDAMDEATSEGRQMKIHPTGERILVEHIAAAFRRYGRLHYGELIDAETDDRIAADGP
jgi:hypothetical protein